MLVTRSPLDGKVSGLDHDGSVSGLIDTLAKDSSLHVLNPLYFTPGEVSTGAHLHLSGFTGRIRDALAISYPVADPLRPVLQWIAECEVGEVGEDGTSGRNLTRRDAKEESQEWGRKPDHP